MSADNPPVPGASASEKRRGAMAEAIGRERTGQPGARDGARRSWRQSRDRHRRYAVDRGPTRLASPGSGCVANPGSAVALRVVTTDPAAHLAVCVGADGYHIEVLTDLVDPVEAGEVLWVHGGAALGRVDARAPHFGVSPDSPATEAGPGSDTRHRNMAKRWRTARGARTPRGYRGAGVHEPRGFDPTEM